MKALKISWKILKWLAIIALSFLFLLFLSIELFDRYLATERGARWFYQDIPHERLLVQRAASGVRYLEIGDADKPPLVLIHGAPGSLFDFRQFALTEKIYDQYRLLIVERPGYGGTIPRKAEPSIRIQAEKLLSVLDNEKQQAVVMGHSYGGPIALVMGALGPEKLSRIYGVSGQYDPENEITFPISRWINYRLFSYLIPHFIWASNVEKLAHPDAQREVLDLYPKIAVPVILVHGNADTLVPYENSTFVKKRLRVEASLITMEGKGHPIHFTDADYLIELLMK